MNAGSNRSPMTDEQLLARIAELENSRRRNDRYEFTELRREAVLRGLIRGSRKHARLKQSRRNAIALEAKLAGERRERYRSEIARRERGDVADIGVTEASPILRGETFAAQKESTWRVKKRPLG